MTNMMGNTSSVPPHRVDGVVDLSGGVGRVPDVEHDEVGALVEHAADGARYEARGLPHRPPSTPRAGTRCRRRPGSCQTRG